MQGEKKNKLPEIKYLLVLDFEATCIENKKLQPCSEIIEFPVIVVNTHTLKIERQFHQYVKPRFNPELTKFCTELTGITQDKVDNGKHIECVLSDFDNWIKSFEYLHQGNYAFLTCGDWDLNTCLRTEAKHKKLQIGQYLKKYINIKKYYPKVTKSNQKSRGMMDMLEKLKIKHQGKHHSGIDDVRNICEICIELVRKYGADFCKKEIVQLKY